MATSSKTLRVCFGACPLLCSALHPWCVRTVDRFIFWTCSLVSSVASRQAWHCLRICGCTWDSEQCAWSWRRHKWHLQSLYRPLLTSSPWPTPRLACRAHASLCRSPLSWFDPDRNVDQPGSNAWLAAFPYLTIPNPDIQDYTRRLPRCCVCSIWIRPGISRSESPSTSTAEIVREWRDQGVR